MVVLLALGGLAEGIGVATMLPLLNVAIMPEGTTGDDRVTELVTGVLAAVGLEPTLAVLLGLIVLGTVLKAGFIWLGMTQVGYTIAHVVADLRLRLIRALLRARWSYFVKQQVGHFTNAVASESHRAAFAYREACTAGAALVQISTYLLIALLISWPVALFAAVAGLGLIRGLRRFVETTRQAGDDQTRLMDSLIARLTDLVLGIKALKAMGLEDRVTPFLEDRTEQLLGAQRRQIRALETLQLVQEPIVAVLLAIGLWTAMTLELASFSQVLVLAIIFYRLLRHFNTLQLRLQAMSEGESAFWSLWAKIEEAEASGERWPGSRPTTGLREELRYEDIRFTYGDHDVLSNVSLVIPAGSFVSLVGESGSGKTTLADLTAGLLEPTGGRILIDGVDLTEIDLQGWRDTIAYVPQELLLFHGSVRENVTLGEATLTDEAVWDALRLSGAELFVQELPEGLNTLMGERGARLSGGQRQRIALARALVRRPSLLILDEVTASLDRETEGQIARVLQGLAGHTTILSISHRPLMTECADLVVEVSAGSVFRVTTQSDGQEQVVLEGGLCSP